MQSVGRTFWLLLCCNWSRLSAEVLTSNYRINILYELGTKSISLLLNLSADFYLLFEVSVVAFLKWHFQYESSVCLFYWRQDRQWCVHFDLTFICGVDKVCDWGKVCLSVTLCFKVFTAHTLVAIDTHASYSWLLASLSLYESVGNGLQMMVVKLMLEWLVSLMISKNLFWITVDGFVRC